MTESLPKNIPENKSILKVVTTEEAPKTEGLKDTPEGAVVIDIATKSNKEKDETNRIVDLTNQI